MRAVEFARKAFFYLSKVNLSHSDKILNFANFNSSFLRFNLTSLISISTLYQEYIYSILYYCESYQSYEVQSRGTNCLLYKSYFNIIAMKGIIPWLNCIISL